VSIPSPRIALEQIGLAAGGWLLSGTAVYLLVAAAAPVPWLPFLTAFLVTRAAMLVVAVPGGIGVLEALMMLLRPPDTPAPVLLVALLLYRVLYYLLPLLAAGALLAARELARARVRGSPVRTLALAARAVAPRLLGLVTFLSGLLLLAYGAIPLGDPRTQWLWQVLPVELVAVSQFLGSIVGAVLVILAWALEARIRLAYELVRMFFVAGILLTLIRSLNALGIGLAVLLALGLGVLLLAERDFPPERTLLRAPMESWWVFTIGAVFLLNVWTVWMVVRRSDFAGTTWWRVVLSPDAPGALRVAVGASVVLLLFALVRLLIQDEPRRRNAGSDA
jgi:phosphatidylglycerol lysyltransferase